jgi:uncharacterized protein
MPGDDPTIRTTFPRSVRCVENEWITMSDGTRLAARIWMPDDAESAPVPAILEYLPYRRDTRTLERDATIHPWFAGHGYAGIRVDIRGTGESDGILEDEYLPLEQSDAIEVIEWIARQPWCSGAVGMMGISWGGFNSLQVAAHRPAALKAIITLCSTDDRYADDVHYMGGCVVSDMLPWASAMLIRNAMPPLPSVVGDGWRDQWLDRMEQTPPYIESWLAHQRRDDFWKQGSICENYDDIECAVFAVGGWADGYSNAIPQMLENLRCPRLGLIGPWPHKWPQSAIPGPRIGFLQECLRWWDHWLKGIDNGIMDEPMLRAWLIDSREPSTTWETAPGRWVSENSWPAPTVASDTWYLNRDSLSQSPGVETERSIRGDQATGQDAGVWCIYGVPGDFPADQRAEDGRSLCFTSEPLTDAIDILGFPELALTVSVDKPTALIAARLCDVSPTGESTLITRGLLNLTHRNSHECPEPMQPGARYMINMRLNAIGWRIRAGHRLRLALSPTYWPMAWPSPETATLTILTGAESSLALPVRSSDVSDEIDPFEAPETAPPLDVEILRTGDRAVTKEIDLISGVTRVAFHQDSGLKRQPAYDTRYEMIETDEFSIRSDDPLSAAATCIREASLGQGDWGVRVRTVSTMTADADSFHVASTMDAFEGDNRVFARTWHRTIPRDHV